MAADWLSNLTSSVKSYLKDDGFKRFKTPSQPNGNIKVRSSSPSVPQVSFSDNVQNRFKSSFAKFKQDKVASQKRLKASVADVVKNLDRNKQKPGFQLISARTKSPENIFTKIRKSNQNISRLPVGQTGQNFIKFSKKLEQSPLGFPGRLAMNLGDNLRFGAQQPGGFQGIAGKMVEERIIDPAIGLAQDLGKAAAQPEATRLFEQTQETARKQSKLYFDKAIQFQEKGDEEKANLYFDAAKKELNKSQEDIGARTEDITQSREKLYQDAVGTINALGIAYNPAGALKIIAGGGTLNTVLKSALNESSPADFLEGMESAADYAGYVNVSNPIIAGTIGKLTAGFRNPVVSNLLARTLSAFGNLMEDRGLSKIYKEDRSIYDDAFSVALGFIMQGGGDIKDYDNLKKELSTFGLNTKDVEAVAETIKKAKSRLPEDLQLLKWTEDGESQSILMPKADAADWTAQLQSRGIEYELIHVGGQSGIARLGGNKKTELPDYLSRAKPRYNYGSKAFIPEFKSDIDRALYITAQTKKSASDDAYRKFLKDNGFTDELIDASGKRIRESIKEQAKILPGGDYKNPQKIVVEEAGVPTLDTGKLDKPSSVPTKDIKTNLLPIVEERANINTPKIKELEAAYKRGDKIPPVPVYEEGGQYITNKDGFHRLQAQRNLGIENIEVKIEPKTDLTGTQKQALERSIQEPETAAGILKQQMKEQLEAPKAEVEEPQVDPKLQEDVTKSLFGEEDLKATEVDSSKTVAPISEADIPVKNKKLRKTYTSMMESESVSTAYKDEFLKDRPDRFYDIQENKESIDQAFKNIEAEGQDKMLTRILEESIDIRDPQNMADAIVLHKMLEDSGNRDGASSLFGHLLDRATASGQTSQMMAIIDKMGPSAMVESAHSFIEGNISKTGGGILEQTLTKFGVKPGKFTGYGEIKQETDGFMDSIKENFETIQDAPGRRVFLDQLIDQNKKIKKQIKNKGDFIDRIVKLAQKPQEDSLFDLAAYTDIKDAVMKEVGIPHMDKAFADHIWNEAARIQKITDQKEKSNATRELIREINKKVPPTFKEVHRAYRYNNVLSGLGTHGRNTWENMLKVLVYQPILIGAEELSHGRILKAMTEPVKFYGDLASNFSKGTDGFKAAMKGEIYPDKFSLEGERQEILPQWIQITRKLLEGEDQFFNKPLKAALEEQKIRQGLSGVNASKQAQIEADEILYKGGYDPENKTGQGNMLSAMDKVATKVESAIRKIPFGDRIVMFPRIATKLTKASIEYSPFGAGTLAGHRNMRGQSIKAAIGTTAMLYSYYQAASGQGRGAPPNDKSAREAYYAEGPAWTIQLGDQNVPTKYLGPLSLSTKMGMLIYDFFNQNPELATESNSKKIFYAGMGILSLVSDETYTGGIKNALDAISGIGSGDTYALDKFIGQNLEQELPFSGFTAWLNKFIDPVKRKGEGILETAVRRQPILSKGAGFYETPEGEPATSDYGVEGLGRRNALLPYDITPVKPEYREIVDERLETRRENAIEKAEEKADEPGYWDRLMDAEAAGDTGETLATGVPKITTTDQLGEKEIEKEGGFLSRLFGKKDKEIEKTYNPGELVTKSSNDTMDVRAITGGRTLKIPKNQEAFNEKYKDIAKVVDDYEEKKNDIIFDDTLSTSKQKRKLKELEEEFGFSSEASQILEENYPEMVLESQIKTYGKGSTSGVENRGDWVVSKLEKLEQGTDSWKDAINKMWEGGVLTGKTTGTLAYILNSYPDLTKSDFKYTGDDKKVAKSTNSATAGKKPKITQAKTPSAPKISVPQVSLKVPKISTPDLSKLRLSSSPGVGAPPSSDFLRVRAPDLSQLPKISANRLKVRGL